MDWKVYLEAPDLLIPMPVIRVYYRLRHPIRHYRDWKKWRDRPKIGELVEDCRGLALTVVGFEDGDEDALILSDGTHTSWMHCCDKPVPKRNF